MARTISLFSYAAATESDYSGRRTWFYAEVRDDGALVGGVPVRFIVTPPLTESTTGSDTTVNTGTVVSGNGEPLGLARLGIGHIGFLPTATYQVTASVNSGSLTAGPVSYTWHSPPELGDISEQYTSPTPAITSAVIYPSGNVDLEWTRVPSMDSHYTRVGYQLERAPTPAGPWTPLFRSDITTVTHTDSVDPAGTYFYRVTGYEVLMGLGGYSDVVAPTPAGETATVKASWGIIAR